MTNPKHLKIVLEGLKMQAQCEITKEKFSVAKLSKKLGVSFETTRRWWARREEFKSTGQLSRKKGSGRKKLEPFKPENIDETLEFLEDLPEDCVKVNHCPAVEKAFKEFRIEMIPSAGCGHNVKNGSPPTSHDLSILAGNLFSTFQSKVSLNTLALPHSPRQTQTCQLFDEVTRLWKSPEYKKKAKLAMKRLPNALKAVIEADGGPTGR